MSLNSLVSIMSHHFEYGKIVKIIFVIKIKSSNVDYLFIAFRTYALEWNVVHSSWGLFFFILLFMMFSLSHGLDKELELELLLVLSWDEFISSFKKIILITKCL